MVTHVVRNASVILMEQRNVTTSTEPAIALTCGLGISVKYQLVSINSSVCAYDVLLQSSVCIPFMIMTYKIYKSCINLISH